MKSQAASPLWSWIVIQHPIGPIYTQQNSEQDPLRCQAENLLPLQTQPAPCNQQTGRCYGKIRELSGELSSFDYWGLAIKPNHPNHPMSDKTPTQMVSETL